MNHSDIKAHKVRIKQGSMGSLVSILDHLLSEAQNDFNNCTERYEWFQSRVRCFNDIKELLPETSE